MMLRSNRLCPPKKYNLLIVPGTSYFYLPTNYVTHTHELIILASIISGSQFSMT